MYFMEFIGYFLSILIGITLGLIGAGGSILSIPLLVYFFKINPEKATTYSLFIVGAVAFFGAARHFKMGNLKIKPALIFAIPSVFSLLIIRNFVLPIMPNQLFYINNLAVSKNFFILIIFAILMILAAISMIKKTDYRTDNLQEINNSKLVIIGLLIGNIVGFLGAGGGFLIIPALIHFAKLPLKQAVGTSLLIIFINSTIGFSSDVLNHVEIDYKLLLIITLFAILGLFFGTELSKKINADKLKPAFGWLVLVIGIYIISKEILLF